MSSPPPLPDDILAILAQVERAGGLDQALETRIRSAISALPEQEAAHAVGGLLIGSEVQLVGLTTNCELNGRTGVILEPEPDRQGERLPVVLHDTHYPKPADWFGGSWAPSKPVQPLALRPRNLRLLGQTALSPPSPPEVGDGAAVSLCRIMSTPTAAAALMQSLLLDPTLRDVLNTAKASRSLHGGVVRALRELDALLPVRKLGGEGTLPGMVRSPSAVASAPAGLKSLAGAEGTVVVMEAGGTVATTNRLQAPPFPASCLGVNQCHHPMPPSTQRQLQTAPPHAPLNAASPHLACCSVNRFCLCMDRRFG